ncbi:DMT family transporter [Halobacillus litoralis]|uniref:DMT family transporter n=1 Tax=Halobacillus litoralis TaxID=45668 RepID=UPI001CFE44E0|nr:DMT family transporter [Halobacillus litoralis]WLR47464.1 DMT family transporter [Halobacillus litoralis]
MAILLLLTAVLGGTMLSAQSSINGSLSTKAGTYETTFLTFITGALILFLLVLFFGDGEIGLILEAPKWQLSAVWFGVGYLFLTVLAVPQIGVIATNISTIIGQLGAGIMIDHYGWFGGNQILFDWKRGLAFLLMLIALRFIYIADKKQAKGG